MAKHYAALGCGHTVIVNVKDGRQWPTEYCRACDAWVDVAEYYSEQWHMVCRECPARSHHGVMKVYAQQSATRHQRATGHRRIDLLWYATVPPQVTAALIPDENATKYHEDMLPPF